MTLDRGYVLVVEDDPATSYALGELLRDEFDLPVRTTDDGGEALAWARRGRPAVVLLDLAVRGLDGADLCEELKQDPRTSAVPVVAVTAMPTHDPRATALRDCADDWIAKPFDVEELFAAVAAHLRRHREGDRG